MQVITESNLALAESLLKSDRLTTGELGAINAGLEITKGSEDVDTLLKFNGLLVRISKRSIHRTQRCKLDILC